MPRRPALREEINAGLRLAFRGLVTPLPEDRKPLTWSTLYEAHFYLALFLFMAYLVRRANTHVIRLLLLPTLLTSVIYGTQRYRIVDSRYLLFEWIRTLMCYYIIAKSLNFAFVKDGRLKVGEKKLREINEPNSISNSGHHDEGKFNNHSFIPAWLKDALEVCLTMRGIGWDFGRGVHIPRNSRPTRRVPYLRAAALSFLKNFMIVDFCDSLLKLIPGVGTVGGGSMFIPDLPAYARYLLSTGIHIIGGTIIICGLEAGNDMTSLVAVGLFGQSPRSWPPLYDNPWGATSLHQFWGKGWHQLLRHTFLILGGYPGYWLAGKTGMVLGTFFASGVYHEIGLQMSDHRVTLFFVLQGVGIILENAWKRLTGRRVSGVVGWVWTAFFVLVLGQMAMDAWAIGGLAGAVFVPRKLSMIRRVVFPAIRGLVHSSRS